MDLLLDVNVVLDLCVPRMRWYADAAKAVSRCRDAGGKVWLYAGSVQTYVYTLAHALKNERSSVEGGLSNAIVLRLARRILEEFSRDKHWLASLPAEGTVFGAEDCEDEHLLRDLDRFKSGSIMLLTRDECLLANHPKKTASPEGFASKPQDARPVHFIDLKSQQDLIRPGIETGLHRVLQHGQYIMGPKVAKLEKNLADDVGVKHCIGVSSGTDALLIAMMALGIGRGDEVVTTPFTFIATGETIALLGAKPVFVDIDRHTYNIDQKLIEQAITPRTKALLPVSLYGQCADMDAINAVAERHVLSVIEDGAQSFGATYRGRRSCGLSLIGTTSFFPSKPLGCYGDAGACFTNDDDLARAMREIRMHGQERRYHHRRIGISGRLDTIQAAVLLEKLRIFPEEVKARSEIGARYSTPLKEAVDVPGIEPYNTSVYAQYTIGVSHRDVVQERLADKGIPTVVHYPVPLHQQPALSQDGVQLPQAAQAAQRVISLPMHPWLSEQDQDRVVEAVVSAVE